MLLIKLKLDFFTTCGYRIECKFTEPTHINNSVVPVLYSELFGAPTATETIAESRDRFRLVLLANHIDISNSELYIINPDDSMPRHNTKVSNIRAAYKKSELNQADSILAQLTSIRESFGDYMLSGDAMTLQGVKTALARVIEKI